MKQKNNIKLQQPSLIKSKNKKKQSKENYLLPTSSYCKEKEDTQYQRSNHYRLEHQKAAENCPNQSQNQQNLRNFINTVRQLGLQIFQLSESSNNIQDSPKFNVARKRTFSFKDMQNYPQNDHCIQIDRQNQVKQPNLKQQISQKQSKELDRLINKKYSAQQFISKLLHNKEQLHSKILCLQREIKIVQLEKDTSQRQLLTQIKQLKIQNESLKRKVQKMRKKYQASSEIVKGLESSVIDSKLAIQKLSQKCLKAEQENQKLISRTKNPNFDSEHESITREHTRQVQQMVNRLKKHEKNRQRTEIPNNYNFRVKSQSSKEYKTSQNVMHDKQNTTSNYSEIKQYKTSNSYLQWNLLQQSKARRYSQIQKPKSIINQNEKQNKFLKKKARYSTTDFQQQDLNNSDILCNSLLQGKRDVFDSEVRSVNSSIIQSKIQNLLSQVKSQLNTNKL